MDKILAIVGIVFSIGLIIYLSLHTNRLLYVTVGILILISCLIWLFIRKRTSLNEIGLQSPSIYLTLNVIFFLFLACSILSIRFTPTLYERPLLYFIFLSIMSGIVVLEILFVHSKKQLALILFQIMIIGLSLVWSQVLIFPSVVGLDTWFHQMFTLNTLNAGFIPEGYMYSNLALMHLEIGSTSLVTGLNYKLATMFSISFLQVLCGILFVFLLGKLLFNEKVGLLASLLLMVGNYYIHMGVWAIPNTIAAVLIPIIIYVLFKIRDEKRLIGVSLTALFMITLIFSHTITAMCMAIILFVSWFALKVYNKIHHEHRKTPVTFTIAIFFIVTMFSWWSYASGHITTLVKLIEWGFSIDFFIQAPKEILGYIATVPFSEQLFNQLGMFLFFALSLIGCFYMISRKYGSSHTFIMTIVGATPLAIGFFSLITGHSVVEQRWWYFSQILLALPLAITFFLLYGVTKNKFSKPILLLFLTFFLSFMMITSPIANTDNHTFSPNTGIRFASTESEIRTAAFFVEKSVYNISSDYDYFTNPSSSIPVNYYNISYSRIKSIDTSLITGEFERNRDIIIIREKIVDKPFRLFGQPFKLNYDPKQSLNEQGFSKIYDCNSVTAFVYITQFMEKI